MQAVADIVLFKYLSSTKMKSVSIQNSIGLILLYIGNESDNCSSSMHTKHIEQVLKVENPFGSEQYNKGRQEKHRDIVTIHVTFFWDSGFIYMISV